MRSLATIFGLVSIGCAIASTQNPSQGDPGWPTEFTSNGNRIIVYQPQADGWKGNHLEARAAVTVTRSGSSQPLYGMVTMEARTEVDKENRLVTLEDLKVKSVSFPTVPSQESDLAKALRESLPQWPDTISLDRLLADLAITGAEITTEAAPLRHAPPRIIFSDQPAVLIDIDGEPFYRSVAGTPYTYVANTPALLLFNSTSGRFYLDGGTRWMTANSLNGPWTVASNPPGDLNSAKAHLLQSEAKDPHDHSHDPGMPSATGPPPVVYVSKTPAELIQAEGAPQYAPIARTDLLYATNTENDLFLNTKTQEFYTLLSGRWYQAKNLNGPWSWVPGKQLPDDFKRIPGDGPKARVLASIPGTEQAKEAVVADQIPQTATVKRDAAKANVTYDGAPEFKPIEATGMQYAANSADDVIYADGRYYAVLNAVWFVSDSPYGPWVVADDVPAVIYSMPPSCPLYHDRFVYVYGATPDYVYEGYTPGYLGAYYDDGVVVFGTGWDYPGWFGDSYYGWPWTWGFGWRFGYWGGGWFDRPVSYGWWYHDPPYLHRVFYNHFGPNWHPGDWEGFRNNVNVYHRWGQNAVLGRNATQGLAERNALTRQAALGSRGPRGRAFGPPPRPAGARAITSREDLYAGRDGRVYQYRQNGWFQSGAGNSWDRVQADRGLESQRQARAFGTSRMNEFRGFGGFSGIAGRPGGFSSMPRSTPGGFRAARPGGFGGRGGGFRR